MRVLLCPAILTGSLSPKRKSTLPQRFQILSYLAAVVADSGTSGARGLDWVELRIRIS